MAYMYLAGISSQGADEEERRAMQHANDTIGGGGPKKKRRAIDSFLDEMKQREVDPRAAAAAADQ